MKIVIDTPEGIARQAAAIYQDILDAKPNAVLGFATGSTPLGLYAELVKMCKEGAISFKDVTTFNLDEYVGLDPTHDQSYRYFMDTNLFNHIDLDPTRVHIPSGIDTSDDALAGYDQAIAEAGGIDMQLLGIGCNGHIGFNEPGTPLESLTHVVELTQNTREVNARFFESLDEVPTHAATMGVKTVMNARKLLLIALGEAKADAVKATVEGPVTPECPASVLQLHPDAIIFCDEAAASKLAL
jgi:glucosamine-6-phosphate deaminase